MTETERKACVELGLKIKKARREAGFTQRQVGEKIGRCPTTICFAELGKYNLRFSDIKKLSTVLNKPTSYFTGRSTPVKQEVQTNFSDRLSNIEKALEKLLAKEEKEAEVFYKVGDRFKLEEAGWERTSFVLRQKEENIVVLVCCDKTTGSEEFDWATPYSKRVNNPNKITLAEFRNIVEDDGAIKKAEEFILIKEEEKKEKVYHVGDKFKLLRDGSLHVIAVCDDLPSETEAMVKLIDVNDGRRCSCESVHLKQHCKTIQEEVITEEQFSKLCCELVGGFEQVYGEFVLKEKTDNE